MPSITSHQLALEIPNTSHTDRMRIIDASVYADSLPVEFETLQILIPGYSDPIVFKEADTPTPLQQGFDRWFTTVDLGLQAVSSDSLDTLPDGLYVIQYSVSPNDQKYEKYYHLRITKAVNIYHKELCKIQLSECEPTAEMNQHLADLRYIKMLLDSAKAKAEFCHAPDHASAMLQYANKLMRKYQDGCCVTCT